MITAMTYRRYSEQCGGLSKYIEPYEMGTGAALGARHFGDVSDHIVITI
jgi:hypothetical protein